MNCIECTRNKKKICEKGRTSKKIENIIEKSEKYDIIFTENMKKK